jgi:hypothetical protein
MYEYGSLSLPKVRSDASARLTTSLEAKERVCGLDSVRRKAVKIPKSKYVMLWQFGLNNYNANSSQTQTHRRQTAPLLVME